MNINKKKIFDLLSQPIKNESYELIEVEFKKEGLEKTIQLFIDSPFGIEIDDCVKVNQVAVDSLGENHPIFEIYNLEVSSPGIFRKLITFEHFKATAGQRIKVNLLKKDKGIKNAVGRLEFCSKNEIRLCLEKDGSELIIPFSKIKDANLEPKLNF